MIRNVDINEISDGKLYDSQSLVKIDCHDCDGCSLCCHVTSDTIILDPYDIYQLTNGLGKSFESLLSDGFLELGVIDGLIQPHIKISSEEKGCPFLNSEGMCSIHSLRPGFCRLFPLGRIYRDEPRGFDYFIQTEECPYENKTKVKIKKWLGIPSLSKYEAFITDWHFYLKDLQLSIMNNPDKAKEINMQLLNNYYIKAYTNDDFYEQYYAR